MTPTPPPTPGPGQASISPPASPPPRRTKLPKGPFSCRRGRGRRPAWRAWVIAYNKSSRAFVPGSDCTVGLVLGGLCALGRWGPETSPFLPAATEGRARTRPPGRRGDPGLARPSSSSDLLAAWTLGSGPPGLSRGASDLSCRRSPSRGCTAQPEGRTQAASASYQGSFRPADALRSRDSGTLKGDSRGQQVAPCPRVPPPLPLA